MDARVVAPLASPGLSSRLREATRDLHAAAERAGCMPALLRGTLPRAGYVALLTQLGPIYAALEDGLRYHATQPCIAPLPLDALWRHAVLVQDLDAFGAGPSPLLPATQAYVERLQALAATAPELLAAHAYVRYLGDLSGGQALARIVARAYGCPPGEGTRFYDFGPSPQALARVLRGALDALPLDAAEADAVVDEARAAFARHVALFEELDAQRAARGPQPALSPGSCS